MSTNESMNAVLRSAAGKVPADRQDESKADDKEAGEGHGRRREQVKRPNDAMNAAIRRAAGRGE